MDKPQFATVTVILPSGRLSVEMMTVAQEVAVKYGLGIYFSLSQNLRLTGVKDEDMEAVKAPFAALGATFKKPGVLHKPRICTGEKYCCLGKYDTEALSDRILALYAEVPTKPKLKIALAGCQNMCSNPLTTDIGVVGTCRGFDVYAGGRGGSRPAIGRRVGKDVDEKTVLEMVGKLIEYHNNVDVKKLRLCQWIDNTAFPYAEV
ncbi:MAG: nitrite reductase [Desulforhopalus sp.]|nr:nitrite reductase [Desulforhopalus sp.]